MKKKNIDNENLETEQIREIINQLRPYLNSDGGDIEFVKYENNILNIKRDLLWLIKLV